MSVTSAYDVAYVRFRAPDLVKMRSFLLDFGLVEAEHRGDTLFMKGHCTGAYLHATELGEPGFIGFGLYLRSRFDLERLSEFDGIPIETLDGPGGGERVRLVDPDGFIVDAVWGQIASEPIVTPNIVPWNEGGNHPRRGTFRRIRQGPAHVLRLGHVVLAVSEFRTSERWYKERFGLVTSDEIQIQPGVAIGAFMRADRGPAETCDHHTVFLFQRPEGPGFIHSAFEVVDVDDLMAGRDHLIAQSHSPFWGVGRHLLGSQIFDYWLDPWGHEIEHWTDGDQLKTSDGGGIATLEQLTGVQWGMPFPRLQENG